MTITRRVIRHSPEFDLIVAPGASVEYLHEGLNAGEGPVWDAARGCLLFTDLTDSLLYRWEAGAGVTVVARDTDHGNGAALARDGRLVLCTRSGVMAISADGERSVVADSVDGSTLTITIDVALRSDGTVYFGGTTSATFEDAGLAIQPDGSVGFVEPRKGPDGRPRSGFGVYRTRLDAAAPAAVAAAPVAARAAAPVAAPAAVALDDVLMPNGLAFSPDESLLYVADTRAAQLRAIPVLATGGLDQARGRVLFDFSGVAGTGLTDGVAVDTAGNVYCAGPGGIWVIDPTGRPLGTICLGSDEYHTNCSFGGPDLRTLFITTHRLLARVALLIPGLALPAGIPGHIPGQEP